MAEGIPPVDARSSTDIIRQVQHLLPKYVDGWPEYEVDPATGQPRLTGPGGALIGVFARFAELIIQRLNQAPEKNFLAFLDLLGASQLPPQPARAPLTFFLAAGTVIDAEVPAGTQVAAPPGEEDDEPVIFETERKLTVTAAQLSSLLVSDPAQDAYADLGSLLSGAAADEKPIFQGLHPVEHCFYLGHDVLFGYPQLEGLGLNFKLVSPVATPTDERTLQWEVWDGGQWVKASPDEDTTANLTTHGVVRFKDLPQIPEHSVSEISSRWLRCRLATPVTPSTMPAAGMVRVSQLPEVMALTLDAAVRRADLPVDAAFANQSSIDLENDFYPFGEEPRYGDTLFLANREAFSVAGAQVTVNVVLTNPISADGELPIPPVHASDDLVLNWEFWDGRAWRLIEEEEIVDDTKRLTKSGDIRFTFPSSHPPVAREVNGVDSCWIRVRIVAGNYGRDADYLHVTTPYPLFRITEQGEEGLEPGPVSDDLRTEFREKAGIVLSPDAFAAVKKAGQSWLVVDAGKLYTIEKESDALQVYLRSEGYHLIPATFAPPSIRALQVDYHVTEGPEKPQKILTYNDFVCTSIETNTQFKPFQLVADIKPSPRPELYLGFSLPPDRTAFPNRPLSLFACVADLKYGEQCATLWPARSRQFGDPGAAVNHQFVMSNPDAASVTYAMAIVGTQWETVAPASVVVAPGSTERVEVRVRIEAGAAPGDVDRGFIRLTRSDSSTPHSEPVPLYGALLETVAGPEIVANERLHLSWFYSGGEDWAELHVRDGTENFTRPGAVEFLPPPDFAPRPFFGRTHYWLKARWDGGDYAVDPRLQRMLLNTITAAQTVTIRNENLGSSNGGEGQTFQTIRTPVLAGQQLDVREPELPPSVEQAIIAQEEGPGAITHSLDAGGRPTGIWVRWHEVADFYGSGPRGRHYVLDHLSGAIQFGDGVNGLIPPVGTGNLRLTRYRTGGGVAGNRPANTIIQLKTTVPYVDNVTNVEPAAGGATAETLESLIGRAPRAVRHRGRAVTLEDYEDLALLASPAVARAKCIPLRDLAANPDGSQRYPGTVSLIIVPASATSKPLPSLELIQRVRDAIKSNCQPNVKVIVVGPDYVQVQIDVELGLVALEGASEVKVAVERALSRFLHPLTGGLDGAGWDFGRKPHRSDIYALLEAIPGVNYVNSLTVDEFEDPAGVGRTDCYLVYSGKHTIGLTYAAEGAD